MARQSSCRLRTGHSHGADYCLHPWADAYSPPKEQHFPLLVVPNPAELFSWTGPGPASCSAGAAAAPPNCPAAPLAPLTAEQVPEGRAVLAVCRQQLPRQWNHASWQQSTPGHGSLPQEQGTGCPPASCTLAVGVQGHTAWHVVAHRHSTRQGRCSARFISCSAAAATHN